jgi:polyferredoxin
MGEIDFEMGVQNMTDMRLTGLLTVAWMGSFLIFTPLSNVVLGVACLWM